MILLTKQNLTVYSLCKTLYNVLSYTHGLIVIQGGVADVANYFKRDNIQILDLQYLQNPNHPTPSSLQHCVTKATIYLHYTVSFKRHKSLATLAIGGVTSVSTRVLLRWNAFVQQIRAETLVTKANIISSIRYTRGISEQQSNQAINICSSVLACITGALWAKGGELVHQYRHKILALFLWRRKSL